MADFFHNLIDRFVEENASDLYLSCEHPPHLRFGDRLHPLDDKPLTEEEIRGFLRTLLSEEMLDEFDTTLEYNTAINWKDRARLRINLFRQRQQTGAVIRRIQTNIPSLNDLALPDIYGQLSLERRGLVLVVGQTGSGKSSSLAAMVEHRNQQGSGHIVTIEDPIEFIHSHKQCIVTQRDVGIDTYSFGIALKNALRQRPDVVVIGEIRDRETMEHAIVFAETGHLCFATLHSSNANQTIERIINFFPEDKQSQVLLNLSLNLKAILSQRLVQSTNGGRALALEILLNQGLIRTLIMENKIREIKEVLERSNDQGMCSFDQSLFMLYSSGRIQEEVAIAEADNPANLRLQIKQHEMSKRLNTAQPMPIKRPMENF